MQITREDARMKAIRGSVGKRERLFQRFDPLKHLAAPTRCACVRPRTTRVETINNSRWFVEGPFLTESTSFSILRRPDDEAVEAAFEQFP